MSDLKLSSLFEDKVRDYTPPTFRTDTIAKIKEIAGTVVPIQDGHLCGLEFEIENCRATDHVFDDWFNRVFGLLWTVTEDGSLRNNGKEFVSKPLGGRGMSRALAVLRHYMQKVYPKADPTGRCGIHVHVNALDINVPQLFAWWTTYLVFERQLYKFSGGREKNLFCLPTWAWNGNMYAAINTYASGNEKRAAIDLAGAGLKYAGLNTLPLNQHGTLEFRMMQTTKDFDKIAIWVDLLIRIKEFAVNEVKTKEELLAFWESLIPLNTTSGYNRFLEHVFKESAKHLRSKDYEKDMALGIIAVKEMISQYKMVASGKHKKPKPVAPEVVRANVVDGNRVIVGGRANRAFLRNAQRNFRANQPVGA